MDLDTLEKQRAEKEERRKAELEAERRYGAAATCVFHTLSPVYIPRPFGLAAEEQERIRIAIARYEESSKEEARRKAAAWNESLKQQMAMKGLREAADLNDPDALRKSRPAREGDFDPKLGVSSAQVFDGEDLLAGERARLQAAQMRQWCLEQQGARASALAEEKAAMRDYAQQQEALGKMRDEYEAAMKAEAARRLAETTAYNARQVCCLCCCIESCPLGLFWLLGCAVARCYQA